MKLLTDLHKQGTTICVVTHDPRYADLADRKIHLFDGHVTDERDVLDNRSAENPQKTSG